MKKLVPPTQHTTQPRHAQERSKAKLEWATVDGVIFHAAQFVGVDPSNRPEGRCQCCEEAIVWKAGDVVVPHVAHRANTTCPSTNPETAEHMNAKAKIAHALTSENALTIASTCSVGHPGSMLWDVAPWAYVQPEYRLNTRRPDVALLTASHDGLAAIEVLHTHAVDKAKAADFAAAGLPWIEVHSRVALEWDEKGPLPIVAADAVTRAGFDAECRQCEETRAWKVAEGLRVAAEKERVQRAFADTLAFAAQQHGIAALEKRSDVLCISAFGFDRWKDGECTRLVGAMVMREGAKPRGARVDDRYADPDWLALDFALAWLEQSSPGRGALIYVDDESILEEHPFERHWGWEVSDIRDRVRTAIVRTGSVLVSNGKANKLIAYWDDDAAHHWRYRIEEFLREEREQYPTDTDHVPRRWLSWWGPWAAQFDGGSS
jgi:hypothetical protein